MKILLGDTLRTTRELSWKVPGGADIDIPAGTVGEVLPWHTSDWGRSCAVKWEGIPWHPVTKYFPMATTRLGVTDYPGCFELVKRKEERMVA